MEMTVKRVNDLEYRLIEINQQQREKRLKKINFRDLLDTIKRSNSMIIKIQERKENEICAKRFWKILN